MSIYPPTAPQPTGTVVGVPDRPLPDTGGTVNVTAVLLLALLLASAGVWLRHVSIRREYWS